MHCSADWGLTLWPGDRYDGKWEDGEQSGVGVFTWADGSMYNGYWRSGRKHGIGVGALTHSCPLECPWCFILWA